MISFLSPTFLRRGVHGTVTRKHQSVVFDISNHDVEARLWKQQALVRLSPDSRYSMYWARPSAMNDASDRTSS